MDCLYYFKNTLSTLIHHIDLIIFYRLEYLDINEFFFIEQNILTDFHGYFFYQYVMIKMCSEWCHFNKT